MTDIRESTFVYRLHIVLLLVASNILEPERNGLWNIPVLLALKTSKCCSGLTDLTLRYLGHSGVC